VAALFLISLVVLTVAYGIERAVRARRQALRRRTMRYRLDAAVVRAGEEQQHRQAMDRASQELTALVPAIRRPPLTRASAAASRPPRSERANTIPGTAGSRPDEDQDTGPVAD
jgi:hypothetical protein